ncbi:ABC transporter ATP-binding protein [Paenibacillus sediminis]|uniref:ABC-2 type transport system ATP-binding protein n=1 Tax=Paenibacillus sediminis TaxID=664909 RepID=A0ABS4H3A3_9BACL|nr:ABC transporter ATP-binding protein [Paenibacillus sediminis]MBP1937006.1 ABC-2 type transport system ATP-binding protein [Paenibacillus sediminis]
MTHQAKMLVQANRLSKMYGSRTVVNHVDIQVKASEIVAIIGPNGAGKSTLIDMILGLRRPDEGQIEFWRKDYLSYVGVQLQATPFFPGLSAYENLRLFAALYKKKLDRQRGLELLRLCGLEDAANTEASKLSGGQQKRLAIAIATVHEPELVFLDEPTAALDPRARREIHEVIDRLASSGKSVVFTSHDMEEVHKLADKVIMIDKGRIIAEGTPVQLCEQYGVDHLEELYLNLTAKEAVIR